MSILTIAGSDSCAGAGMQIDLKTAAAHGVYATCCVTAVTAQNIFSVNAVQAIAPDVVASQIRSVFADIPPAAIKIGMLGSVETARAVKGELETHPEVPVVLDPVLVATSGGKLAADGVLEFIRDELMPHAAIVTPNIPEACALSSIEIEDVNGMDAAARALLERGAHAVLIKGGHAYGERIEDRLYVTDGEVASFFSQRLDGEYHGTGCSLSTAIACNLSKGMPLCRAVEQACAFISRALRHPLCLGSGSRIFDPMSGSEIVSL